MSTFQIDREELRRVFNPRAARAFEDLQDTVATQGETQTANVAATDAIAQASYITLSANAELPNEYVLSVGEGLSIATSAGAVVLTATGPRITGTHTVNFIVTGHCNVVVPLVGTLATLEGPETMANKTLDAPSLTGLVNAANDAAAAGAGVPVGGIYRNGSVVMVRVA